MSTFINTVMNIGEVAKHSGVHAKMIRHYEAIGLLPKARRAESGYRVYGENDVNTLRFIRRSRDLGFPVVEIKKLLSLWRNRTRQSAEVRALAAKHIKNLEAKIGELQSMRNSLQQLVSACRGDHRPDCPIITNIGGEPPGRKIF